ncbi:DUF3397 domain-containing protein [bacterium LRH843]|nr:DUF3397 domain-containing protein [bacterium LRH843]
MLNLVAWVMATVVTIPPVGWYITYFISVKLMRSKPKAMRAASDYTSILFMAAVYFIMYELWNRSFLWVILAVFFLIALLFTWMHWSVSGDIHTKKLFKGIWRLNFIFFLMVYLLLSGYGLVSRLVS